MYSPQVRAIAALVLLCPAAALAAAQPDEATRPRVAIVAENSGAETTDLLVPLAVLRDAGVDVSVVAVAPGPVSLMPGLTILPDATLADIATPPEIAVVPAMHDPSGAALHRALRDWAARGTLLVSICDGAWVLANAGLLADRAATSHWFSMSSLRSDFPATHWRHDRRWVRDGNVITSAGVSASLPVSRHLVTLLAGQPAAAVDGPPHDGSRFTIGARDVAVGAQNYLLPWRAEVVAIELRDGVDELALGMTVDLLHRTLAVSTVTFVADASSVRPEPVEGRVVRGRRGLRIVADAASAPEADRTIIPEQADFDLLLADIEQRYGAPTRRLVALQIEYAPGRF